MNRLQMLEQLGLLPEQECRWEAGWDESMADMDDVTASRLVDAGEVEQRCRRLQMDEEMTRALVDGLALLGRVPALKQLLWHCHYVLFRRPHYTARGVSDWPQLPSDLDPNASLFYVYVYLSGVDALHELHGRHGVPPQVTLATLQDLGLWIRHYHDSTGRWGLGEIGWLWNHFSGRLYQLGRLQFEMNSYYLKYPFFRHRSSRRVIALAQDEQRFRADGQVNGADGIEDPQAWTAHLRTGDTGITGNPIDPRGWALPRPLTLATQAWEQVLAPRDPTLGVHITAEGPMDFDRCRDSLAQAIPFFARCFPDFTPRAFVCSSWLLDYQLAEKCHPQSNIARFVQEWYLLPRTGASDRQILERVFGSEADRPPAQWPQDTTLRRIVVTHMQAGGRWRDAGGVILAGDEQRWGERIYQRTADLP